MSQRQSISIALQDKSVGAASSYWLVLKQVQAEGDTLAIDEAADFIDSLYDSEPCDSEQTGGDESEIDGSGALTPPVVEADFLAMVQDFMAETGTCRRDGSWTCQITVARSHQDEPYNLVLDNGRTTVTRRVQERVSRVLAPEREPSMTLDVPVLGNFVSQWEGPVFDRTGACTPPEITVLGSTVNFGREVTGSLRCSFDTVYDLVDCEIDALPGSTEPAPCRALGFYAGMVEELELAPPEPDDDADAEKLCPGSGLEPTPDNVSCYEVVRRVTRCRCSENEVDVETVEQSLPCPPGMNCPGTVDTCRALMGTRTVTAGYVSCPEEEGQEGTVSDPNYYFDHCCGWPPPDMVLPPCKEYTTAFQGGKGVSDEVRALYPGAVFVAVSPPDGICGEVTTTWQVPQLDCCNGVPPLAWNADLSASVMSRNEAASVWVTGGSSLLSKTWTVHGQGFWMDYAHTRKTVVTAMAKATVFTDDTACGAAVVEVTDGCSTTSGTILCTYGEWQAICEDVVQPIDCDCGGISAGGTMIGSLGSSATFEAIENGMRLEEYVGCVADPTESNCGQPGIDDDGACCAMYSAQKPNWTWPPCLSNAEDFVLAAEDYCNPAFCATYAAGCVTCDSQGGVHQRPPPPIVTNDDLHLAVVRHRKLYEWVCP
jgi:hypothetical protein